MTTKEAIKAEVDRLEDTDLDELYGIVRRLARRARSHQEGARPGSSEIGGGRQLYIGSPRLVRQEQAVDFEKEVVEDRADARL